MEVSRRDFLRLSVAAGTGTALSGLVGSGVNLEAGSIVCNYRNERTAKEIWVRLGATLHGTGCEKFGALLGDNCRIGANAVVAPGALLDPGTVVGRAALCDQELDSSP